MKQPILNGILESPLDCNGFPLVNPAGGEFEVPLTFSSPLLRTVNTISIPAATGSVDGYLAHADWNTFNNKVSTSRHVNTASPLDGGGALSGDLTLSISVAGQFNDGYLSAADWNIFTGKQAGSANLTSWAAITRASGFDTFTATPSVANLKSLLTNETDAGWALFSLANPSAITFLRVNADNSVSALDATTFRTAIGAGTGAGSVTSVGLAMPNIFSVSNSPVTTTGTLTVSLQVQNPHLVFASGTGAGSVTPTFRALVSSDLPLGAQLYDNAGTPKLAADFGTRSLCANDASQVISWNNPSEVDFFGGNASISSDGSAVFAIGTATIDADGFHGTFYGNGSNLTGLYDLILTANQSVRRNAGNTAYEAFQAQPYSGGTLSIASGKTLTASNTLTLSGTDGSTLAIGTGGTLGTAAYTSSGAYQPIDSDLTSWASVTRASGFDTFVATPTSANLAALVTDENGSGKVLFAAGTINITSGKTVAFGNSMTLNGFDGSLFTFPNFGSDTVAVLGGAQTLSNKTLASPTFTGTVTTPNLTLSGDQSAAAWTTSGLRIVGVAGTLTDTTSSGTVAAAYTNKLGGNTIAASSATTFTDYISSYFSEPVAGTNVTLTNKYALGADSLKVGTSNAFKVTSEGNVTVAGTLTLPGASIADAALSANVPLLNAANVFSAAGNAFISPKITTGINDANNNSMLAFTATGSAVEKATLANAASGGSPLLTLGSATIAANTVVNSLLLTNTNTASSGNQMYSSALVLRGNGWSSSGGLNSTPVDFRIYTKPVQGGTASANLVIESSVNGGAYNTGGFLYNSDGATLSITNLRPSTLQFQSSTKLANDADGTLRIITSSNGDGTIRVNSAIGLTSNSGGWEANNGNTSQWIPFKLGTHDSGTNTITNGLTHGHQYSSALTNIVAGFGIGELFNADSTTTPDTNIGRFTFEWVDPTHATRKARGKLWAYDTAARECIRFEASGSAPMVGFYGHAAAAQSSAYTPTNVSTDRSWDCSSTSLNEIANVLATVVQDLQAVGLIG